jgi:hypothetical protein
MAHPPGTRAPGEHAGGDDPGRILVADGRRAPMTWLPGGLPRPPRARTQMDVGKRARRRRATDAHEEGSWPRYGSTTARGRHPSSSTPAC